MLEGYLMTVGIRNVGQGVGAILSPVLNNLQWVVAAIIAKEGWDKVVDIFDNWKERRAEAQVTALNAAYAQYLATTEDEEPMTYEEWQDSTKRAFKRDPLSTALHLAKAVQAQADE